MSRRFLTPAQLTKLQFVQSSDAGLQEGELVWDSEHKSLAFGLSSAGSLNLEVGLQTLAYVYNSTGATITRGNAVYIYGAFNNRPIVDKARADSDEQTYRLLGIVLDDIANGSYGYVAYDGVVSNVNTSGFTVGDELYLSESTAGGLTATRPAAPNSARVVGYCLKVGTTDGIIFVRMGDAGSEVEDLHNVSITSLADNDFLRYDAASGLWKNEAVSLTGGGPAVTFSASPPSGATQGQLYVDNETFDLFAYYDSFWVQLPGSGSAAMAASSASGTPLNTANTDIARDSERTFDITGIDFDVSASATAAVGRLKWNDGDGTLEVGLKGGNSTLQIGQENVALCYNGTGSSLTDGKVVYISGAQGQRPSLTLAQANSESTSSKSFGVVTETIADGQEGFVTTFGVVRGVDTSSFAPGTALWLSSSVAGGLTSTRPTAPNHGVFIGYSVKQHASAGEIFVNIQNGYEIDELHDALITSKADNDILTYSTSASAWVNQNLATAILEVDGSGSGIDADTLDGQHGTYYAAAADYLSLVSASTNYQPLDGDLTAIAALTGTNGYLKKTDTNTWSLDTKTFIDTSATEQTKAGNFIVSGDITVQNLTVLGTQSISNVDALSVTDSIILLADGNFDTDAIDIGFVGAYGIGASPSHLHSGLVRDATDKEWYLVSGIGDPSSGVLNFSASTIVYDTLSLGKVHAYSSVASPTNIAPISYGTLSYTDSNILATFSHSVNDYSQLIVQNTSASAAASADIIVSNNLGTAETYYGDFGINSSNFAGTGSLSTPNSVYLTATSGELAIGTTTANGIHFVVNDGATDALAISSAGDLSVSSSVVVANLNAGLLDGQDGTYYAEMTIPFSKSGAISVAAGTGRYRFPWAATILGATASINTAPTGASLICDVNKNGTTIFTNQANRPTISAGSNATSSEPTPDVTSIAAGDYITVDVDQVGSTIAGSDLTVIIRYRRA